MAQLDFDNAMKQAVQALNAGEQHLQISVMYSEDNWYFTATKLCIIKRTCSNPTNPHICFNENALKHHNINYEQWYTLLRQ